MPSSPARGTHVAALSAPWGTARGVVDDVAVRRDVVVNDCERADGDVELQLLLHLPLKRPFERLAMLDVPPRKHPVARSAFHVVDEQYPSVPDEDRLGADLDSRHDLPPERRAPPP